jgi:hypothetical protein
MTKLSNLKWRYKKDKNVVLFNQINNLAVKNITNYLLFGFTLYLGQY